MGAIVSTFGATTTEKTESDAVKTSKEDTDGMAESTKSEMPKSKPRTRPPPRPSVQIERARTQRATKIYNSSSMKVKWLAGDDMKKFYDIDRLFEDHYVLGDEAFDFGATSEVYRCKGKRNNREYACKIIDKRKMFSRQRHRCNPGVRMKAEIINCSKLKHPHLIDIIDVFETGDSIYVVMELMQGGQLFNYVIERNSLTEKEASDIIKQVTEALAYMHENGVLHRDLKAENILLTSSDASKRPFIKVVDFGMSKEVNGAKTSSVLGTPGYQAPECMLGQKYSTAVDCFSLGCLTYILLCGYMPLYTDEGTDSQKVIFPESEWADISEDARDFVSNLIEYEPEKRLSCADALKHKWLSDSMLPPSGPPSLTLSPSLKSVDFLSHPLTEKGRLSRVQSCCSDLDPKVIEAKRKLNAARSKSITEANKAL